MNFHLVGGFTMRYFIYLAYDGTNYHGWQIQPNGDSVQETLMRALSTFLRQEIEVVGAGRTDAGVQVKLKVASSLYLYAEPKVGIRTDTYDGSEQGRPDRVASMVGGLLYRFKMPTFQ